MLRTTNTQLFIQGNLSLFLLILVKLLQNSWALFYESQKFIFRINSRFTALYPFYLIYLNYLIYIIYLSLEKEKTTIFYIWNCIAFTAFLPTSQLQINWGILKSNYLRIFRDKEYLFDHDQKNFFSQSTRNRVPTFII